MAPHNSTNEYLNLLNELGAYHVPKHILDAMSGYVKSIYQSELDNRFSAPMLWIGLYIAFASLICIFAMGADLVHGFLTRKIWVPCKYFRVNSFYLTVISVAMKLPVDLTGLMPGRVDQVAKIGSMAFMCTIMGNLLPFLSTMDENDIYSNVAALGVLVITMVVNVCIQIKTGVVSTSTYDVDPPLTTFVSPKHHVVSLPRFYSILPIIYVTLLLVLLILYVSSCLLVLAAKKELESRFQYRHEVALSEIGYSSERLLTVEKLEKYVTKHWVMARTCSSQFVFTSYIQTTCASGLICIFVAILHILTIIWTFDAMLAKDYDSDYSWSTVAIVIFQVIGVMIGTIAPLCRCFTPVLSLKTQFSFKYFLNDVDFYWGRKAGDWVRARIGLPSPQLELVIQILRNFILILCNLIQFLVWMICKIIDVSFVFLFFFLTSRDGSDNFNQEEKVILEGSYVGLGEELLLNEGTEKGILSSVKQLIQEGEKKKPSYIVLLEKSTAGFYGVERLEDSSLDFYNFYLSDDELEEYQNCWSLQVVTVATIARSLPEIKSNEWLVRSVRELLVYVMVVDESLNSTCHYILDAVKELWKEVDVDHKWLGNKLPDPSNSQLNTARQVILWFKDTTNHTSTKRSLFDKVLFNSDHKRIFITSMYNTSLGILNSKTRDDYAEFDNQQNLFDCLSLVIADTITACLTNLPQIIINKCHPSVVEEREVSVKGASLLLGQTKQIIEKLQQRNIPNINPKDRPFFDKWRAYLRNSRNA